MEAPVRDVSGTGPAEPPAVRCPECGGPATVIDRFVLYRTTGPVLHLRTACTSTVHFAHPLGLPPGT